MDKNVRIAKQLVKLARSLMASEQRGTCKMWDKSTGDFFDGHCALSFDSNDDANANEAYVKELTRKISSVFPNADYYHEDYDDTYRIGYKFDEEDMDKTDIVRNMLEKDGWEIQDEMGIHKG